MANHSSEDDLKNNLTEMQFYVTQNHGTEPPYTGRLLHNKRDGVYHCLVCDAPLFNSQTNAMPIWATYFRMARSRPASAIALIRRRWHLRMTKTATRRAVEKTIQPLFHGALSHESRTNR